MKIRQLPDRSVSSMMKIRPQPDQSGCCLIKIRQLPDRSGHCLIKIRQPSDQSGSCQIEIRQLPDRSEPRFVRSLAVLKPVHYKGHFIVEASWVLRSVHCWGQYSVEASWSTPCVPLPLDLTLPCYCWHCQGLSLPCHPLLYSTALHHTVDSARCTVNSEQSTVNSALWTVNSAQCTVNSVRREVISFIWGLAVQTVLSFSSVATTVWCSTLQCSAV